MHFPQRPCLVHGCRDAPLPELGTNPLIFGTPLRRHLAARTGAEASRRRRYLAGRRRVRASIAERAARSHGAYAPRLAPACRIWRGSEIVFEERLFELDDIQTEKH